MVHKKVYLLFFALSSVCFSPLYAMTGNKRIFGELDTRDARALFNQAERCFLGDENVHSYSLAFTLYDRLAAQPFDPAVRACAQARLGEGYLLGVGVKEDVAKGRMYLKHALSCREEIGGNWPYWVRIQARLADSWFQGQEYDRARELFELVVTQDTDKHAQIIANLRLGQIYLNGWGVERSRSQARIFLRHVADQDIHADARDKALEMLAFMAGIAEGVDRFAAAAA